MKLFSIITFTLLSFWLGWMAYIILSVSFITGIARIIYIDYFAPKVYTRYKLQKIGKYWIIGLDNIS